MRAQAALRQFARSAALLLCLALASATACIGAAPVDAAQAQPPAATRTVQLPEGVTDNPLLNSRFLLFAPASLRRKTLRWVQQNHRLDMAAAMIHAMRFHAPEEREALGSVLSALTGEHHDGDWFAWMLWLEAHPEVQTFAGFDLYLSDLFGNLDPVFKQFLFPRMPHRIRLEEIVWGGVGKDGIPALTNPNFIRPADARLEDAELVFGVAINGDVRAYPFRYMDWHEMVNDVVGGVPVSLAYCTLCGSGILFDTRRQPDAQNATAAPFVFGSSGLLYRSNKLMYDEQTHSLWNQFTGEPVTGALTNAGIVLPVLPVTITSWGEWRRVHADTRVLAHDTGYTRDYRPGAPYGRYFASSKLLFPALVRGNATRPKAFVFVLRMTGAEHAWALERFAGGQVINDRVGVVDIVLVGNAQTRTVRAYRRGAARFARGARPARGAQPDALVDDAGVQWAIAEDALSAPDGRTLPRLPGHVAYAFAFGSYFPRPGPGPAN